MSFENYFIGILKTKDDSRIMKLIHPLPEPYLNSMESFLQTFFEDDPFEIKPGDLETYFTPTGKIKRLKFDRKPTTYFSIFRFLELYRQQLSVIKKNINTLAGLYKKIGRLDSNEKQVKELREKILSELLNGGRFLKKWNPMVEALYKILFQHINSELAESEENSGQGKAFVNLRKIHSDSFLKNTFHPYYDSLVNFCLFCLAYSSRLSNDTSEMSQSLTSLLES